MELDNTRPCPQAGSFCVTLRSHGPCRRAASSAQGSRPVQQEGTPPSLWAPRATPRDLRQKWQLRPLSRQILAREGFSFLAQSGQSKTRTAESKHLRPPPFSLPLPPECNRGSGKAPMGSEGTGLEVVVFVLTFITCQTWFFLTRRPGPCGTQLHPRCGRVCLPGPRDGDASQNRLTVEPP